MAPRSEDPKLIIRVINFELVQPICSAYRNVTDRQTDRRTTYDSNTALALRASRGKNWENSAKSLIIVITGLLYDAVRHLLCYCVTVDQKLPVWLTVLIL